MFRKLIFIVIAALICSYIFNRYFGICGSNIHITLGTSNYCIPIDAAEYEVGFNPFSLIPGLDESPENTQALILFSRFDYKNVVPDYEIERNINNEPMEEDLVLISYLTDKEVELYKYHGAKDKYFQDLWFGEGQWRERRLESFGELGWYRAYWLAKGGSWQVLRDEPSRDSKNYLEADFSIAFCHFTVLERKTCKTHYLDENKKILVDLDLDEENLPYREDIGTFIINSLESWSIKTTEI